MNPDKHHAHTFLFFVAAVCTVVYGAITPKTALTLTNLKLLSVDDLSDKLVGQTKASLYAKWKCEGVDPWGPDSMCRCIARKECTGDTCLAVEKECYGLVVPAYATVFAGHDIACYNITIAFVFLHIAILMNMVSESRDWRKMESEGLGERQPLTSRAAEDTPDAAEPVLDNTQQNTVNARWGMAHTLFGGTAEEEAAAEAAAAETAAAATAAAAAGVAAPSWASNLALLYEGEMARLVVLVVLSIIALGFSIAGLVEKDKLRDPSQVCGPDNECLTQTFVGVATMTVSLVNLGLFLLEIVRYRQWEEANRDKPNPNKTTQVSNFTTVWEEANHTVAFMLLTASFGALGGVHDDTTILFDILVVAFLGFLQSVQHHIMVWREHVIVFCLSQNNENFSAAKVVNHIGQELTVNTYILSYFLYSRLFVFVVMIGSSIVFLERIEPSMYSNDVSGTWYYYMRNAALLISVLPSIVADVLYEINHMATMKEDGRHTPYEGASFWRRTIFLLYMIGFVVLSSKTYAFEKI